MRPLLGRAFVVVALSLALGGCGGPEPSLSDLPRDAPTVPPDVGEVPLRDVPAEDFADFARPGTGRDAIHEEFRSGCLVGPAVVVPEPTTVRRLARPFGEEEVRRLLGHEGSTRRMTRLADGTSPLAFVLRANPRSLALVYGVEHRAVVETLDLSAPTFLVDPSQVMSCGDRFVARSDRR